MVEREQRITAHFERFATALASIANIITSAPLGALAARRPPIVVPAPQAPVGVAAAERLTA